MFALKRFGIKLELATIQRMLKELGNPQNSFTSIHIAGTNGKGSIAAGITSILRIQGYRVGLYTSPHLIEFNERITINGQKISNAQVVEAYQAVKKAYPGIYSSVNRFDRFPLRDFTPSMTTQLPTTETKA